MGEMEDERNSQASQLFENFVQASTCKGTLQAFGVLCRQLELDPADHQGFYSSLKAAVTSWKAKALWTKLDKRASHKEYKKGQACTDTRCLIIGSGPCGLRTAIEMALLGAKVVVIEKRDTFSRNNVLHLWPFTIHDLRNLGAKKFYGKFCAGAIDHISIRQLQLILLKVSLIVGVEVHVNVEFLSLLEPSEEQGSDGLGWRAEIRPAGHPISDYEFDVLIGADGRRSTLDGFRRKEFRGKLAIAITANFVNRNTTAEAKVEEISGVAFIFNQKFFLELKEETGIDLENIVYYKDNTHYFVMTAKKQSLLDKGVIIHDYIETERLLHSDNVNQEALLSYAREAADFGTNYQLPSLDYAINHYGQPDVAMFDFTCMYASENAALIREKSSRQLLVALVGDSLLEPFWPMGTGCARGFLAAFDTAWMVQGWAQGKEPLEILSERESIYRLLPQTTAENIMKNFEQYTIDPATRYPNLNSSCVRPHQVRHLYINGEQSSCSVERGGPTRRSVNITRRESEVRPSRLLLWCQKQTQGYRGVDVTDLTTSWKSGLALCALIHRQRPDLIDFDSLNEADCARNNQLAFEVAERAFGIQPLITGKEMAAVQEPDKLVMVLYLSKFYEMFRNSSLPAPGVAREKDENSEDYSSKSANSVYNLMNISVPRKRVPKDDKKLEDNDPNKKRRKGSNYAEELSSQGALTAGEGLEQKENKVRSMATQLLAKFEENAPSCALRRQSCGSVNQSEPDSDSSVEKASSLDMAENPRFAKPKHVTQPPPPPPKPKWKPSPYLRLLESQLQPGYKHGNLDNQHSHQYRHVQSPNDRIDSHAVYQTPEPQFSYHTTEPWSCPQTSEPRSSCPTPEPRPSSSFHSPLAAQLVSLDHLPKPKDPSLACSSLEPLHSSTPALGGMFLRLQQLEDQISQKKAQTRSAREFSRKSIRERAEQLSFLFSGKPPQVDGPSPAPVSPTSKPLSVHSLPACSALSCLLSPPPPPQQKQCNGCSESQQNDHQRHADRSEIKRIECLDPSKQRTVGKVSSAIGVKAATLAILYETDHRPNNPVVLSLANVRREFAPGVGGSDICHFCKKRVYVMERLSAEGYFFHRECFRCDVCNTTLRLGGHVFDCDQNKFYCKLHFSQRKASHRHRKKEIHGGGVSSVDGSDGYSATGSLRSQPSDTLGVRSSTARQYGRVQNGPLDPSVVTESPSEERLSNPPELISTRVTDSSVQDTPTESEPLGPNSPQLKVERSFTKGGITTRNNWKKKFRAKLIWIKTPDRSRVAGGDDALIEEDGDSDFEEIHVPDPPAKPASETADPHCPLQDKEEQPAPVEIPHYRTHGISASPKPSTSSTEPQTVAPDKQNALIPKKKLSLSSSEKEKLLDWDLMTPEKFSEAAEATDRSEKEVQSSPENQTKPQKAPDHSPPLSGFQLWASALRKSFSSSGNNTKVIRRNRPPRARPLSEGSFSLSSVFGASTQIHEEDEERARSRGDMDGSQPCSKSRSEITAMLEEVTLSTKPPGGSKDDMASLPPRKLNFFSSLRVKRTEGVGRSRTDSQTKDIWAILSKFRNKASTQEQQQQQKQEEDNSSSEEGPESTTRRSDPDDSERQRRNQEKMLLQQSKREQLKRLHRAQVIQRQLEEVEEKQRVLEEKGVTLEKVLRGEQDDPSADEAALLQSWFKLVLEKNKLARYESELMIFAQELELEDRQSQLQQELRGRMAVEDCEKSAGELAEEQALLVEVMKVVEERDRLVSLLEEQRLQEKAEDRDLEGLILSKGYQFHWA
ncbi:protein-methionine sulfoxide oxidase mical2b isoform X1 [Pygocentrus nattereri]|uniref:F-actin monooxygenase n=1 Tax=Pygocentrus nattereri TaxID=42514 RepID=A0A3B4DPX2_PYGNA|nr:protein-methionine sulfoxide oxidase mical2b isoform X1 [Pygocentrus nattereri]